jgi:signal transduction histidine kinase
MEQERLAAIEEFAAMIVHEIRNPPTTVMVGLNYAQKKLLVESQERFSLALSEAARLERLLSEILMYAKLHPSKLEELEMNPLIDEWPIEIREMPEAQNRHVHFAPLRSGAKVLGDRDKLKQVLINIIRNACEAINVEEVVHCKIEQLPLVVYQSNFAELMRCQRLALSFIYTQQS